MSAVLTNFDNSGDGHEYHKWRVHESQLDYRRLLKTLNRDASGEQECCAPAFEQLLETFLTYDFHWRAHTAVAVVTREHLAEIRKKSRKAVLLIEFASV